MNEREPSASSTPGSHRYLDHVRTSGQDVTPPTTSTMPSRPGSLWCLPTTKARAWLIPPLLFTIAGVLALAVDVPVSTAALTYHCPGLIRDLLRYAEMFGNGLGVVLLTMAIWALDRVRRPALPRLVVIALGSGLAVNVLKLLV